MIETLRAKTGIAPTELRYLALGDSYTIGEGVADAGRWPVQLVQALRADGLAITDPQVIAQTVLFLREGRFDPEMSYARAVEIALGKAP